MKLRIALFSIAFSLLTALALPVVAQTPTTNTVSYNGFSFSYDSTLAGHISIDEVAGDAPDVQQPGGPEVKNVQFLLAGAGTSPTMTDASMVIHVYNTADFANYPNQTGELQKLQGLVSAQTDLTPFMSSSDTTGPNNLPFLPPANAAQVIRARAHYVSTPTVSGVSYVTVYRQDVAPFLGNEFVYTFQGMSSDATHYVSAVFKLNTALFPAEIPANFDMNAFNTGFNDYLTQSVTTLNNAQPTDFSPSLASLDAIVQSFNFAPSSVALQPTVTAPAANADPTLGGLTQANWVLATYGTAEAPIPALPQAPINLIFTADGISGSSGCNTYFGQFKYDLNVLSFSGIGSTLIACTDSAVMTQESDYLNALRTATSYEINNGVLKITYQEGVLTFNPNGTTAPVVTPTPVVGGSANLGGLAGVNWVLSSFGPADAQVAVIPGSSVTAAFTTEGVSGNAGCNTYNGNFTYNDGTLTFTPLVTTKMACADEAMTTQETTFLNGLQAATGYQIANGQLQIAYPDGVLIFNPDVTPTATPALSLTVTPVVNTDPTLGGLAGVHWVLVSLGPTSAPITALPDAQVNIDFTAQGVSGNAGCNQYSGNFQYNAGSLTFSPLVTTQKACADNIMTQEMVYLAALQTATAYQVANGQLQITYPDGVLVYTAGA